jgi:hypothetical protein
MSHGDYLHEDHIIQYWFAFPQQHKAWIIIIFIVHVEV